ncbi:MAG: hypothetical protein ACRDSF_23615 [Pseudonocardiaceae bacterium]
MLGDLAPLGSILLEQLTDRLSDTGDHRLLVVPIGRARSIPWTAVITIPWVSITAVKPVKGSCLLPE